jgi:hypothetical protein
VKQDEMAVARQWHGKHVSAEFTKYAAIEEVLETMFSTQSIPSLYSKNQWTVELVAPTQKDQLLISLKRGPIFEHINGIGINKN